MIECNSKNILKYCKILKYYYVFITLHSFDNFSYFFADRLV